jgi:hypothetical protein
VVIRVEKPIMPGWFWVLAWCILCLALPLEVSAAGSEQGSPLMFITDKTTYTQGEIVHITVRNISDHPVLIADRRHVDGGFATIETRTQEGQWQNVELYAAANVTTFRTLPPGGRYEYLWQTVGYNRAETVAPPGTYRISFGQPVYTNLFEIKSR